MPDHLYKYRFWYMPKDPRGELMTVSYLAHSIEDATEQFEKRHGGTYNPARSIEISCEGVIK